MIAIKFPANLYLLALIMNLNKKLLTLKEVSVLVSMSRSTIYRSMDAGDFPRPLKIGSRMVRWAVDDIDDYLKRLSCAA